MFDAKPAQNLIFSKSSCKLQLISFSCSLQNVSALQFQHFKAFGIIYNDFHFFFSILCVSPHSLIIRSIPKKNLPLLLLLSCIKVCFTFAIAKFTKEDTQIKIDGTISSVCLLPLKTDAQHPAKHCQNNIILVIARNGFCRMFTWKYITNHFVCTTEKKTNENGECFFKQWFNWYQIFPRIELRPAPPTKCTIKKKNEKLIWFLLKWIFFLEYFNKILFWFWLFIHPLDFFR